MKFDHLMWAVAIVLAILNGSGVIGISWWWVASPVILIFGIGAFYGLLLLWMKARDGREIQASYAGRATREGDDDLIYFALVLFIGGCMWLMSVLADKWEAGKREAEAREEAAIMAKYGIEPKDWEYMTPEERALFK